MAHTNHMLMTERSNGSAVVCGGHVVPMDGVVSALAVWWCVVDMWSNGCARAALAVWWCVVDMGSNKWRGQCMCWQCGGVWWTWGPMDGVVSARAGSVVVCGGHGVQ